MIPKKLKKGDTIHVISPATSLKIIPESQREATNLRFRSLGLNVTFSENAEEFDEFESSSIDSRIVDFHKAFLDKKVNAIITTIGGFNSNQLLGHINYGLIKKNPKVFCGYSDITALQNAIYKKTKLVTYSGPHYSTFGMHTGFEYTLEYFKKCLMSDVAFEVKAAEEWSDDQWFLNQSKRLFIKNDGMKTIFEGKATGTILGGNLCTFNLLQGTEFMPSLKKALLFIEDDESSNPKLFDRNLQSLTHQPDFEWVKAIIIGRFQKASQMTGPLLEKIIKSKKELKNMPIIYNADFGHTTPQITFPIGGKAKIDLIDKKNPLIEIITH